MTWTRFVVMCALASFAQTPARPDPPDVMATAYGNTITIEIAGQYFARRYVDADHTYRDVAGYAVTKGTWAIDHGQVCFTQTEPRPDAGPATRCNAAEPHQVGDRWTNVDVVTGATVLIALVAGRK